MAEQQPPDPRDQLPPDERERYLGRDALQPTLEFVRGALWQQMKRALVAREPVDPDATDDPSTAAHKSFLGLGYRRAIAEIDKLPFDVPQLSAPAIPETITDPRD